MFRMILSLLAVVFLLANPAFTARLYVSQSAAGAGDGSDWANAFIDLQDALAVATPGTEIWVAEGVYLPGTTTGTTFQLLSGVSLYGGFAGVETDILERDWEAHPTQLSGDIGQDDYFGTGVWYTSWYVNTANVVHVVTGSGTDNSAVLDGFEITHGYTSSLYATNYLDKAGAGMFIINGSPTIRNCTFYRNAVRESDGGAIFNSNSSPLIQNCTFEENFARFGKGAAIYNSFNSSPVIEGCRFLGNIGMAGTLSMHATSGAAICHNTAVPLRVRNSVFENNEVLHFSVGTLPSYGGGIYSLSADMIVDACVFSGNKADVGAGIADRGDNAIVANSLFTDNYTVPFYPATFDQGNYGAGIGLVPYDSTAETRILNCTFSNNSAGTGGGIGGSGNAVVVNSIVWGNLSTAGGTSILDAQISSNFSARYTCIEGITVGPAYPGTINVDPLLSLTYELATGSPAIDAGDNNALFPWIKYDLTGIDRFIDDPSTADVGIGVAPIVDMGANEFKPPCNKGNPPDGLSANPIGSSQVELSWNAVSDADKYQINGNLLGMPALSLFANDTSRILTGLVPGGSYYWMVRARCASSSEITAFSLVDTFVLPLAKANDGLSEVGLYPNPASSDVNLSLQYLVGEVSVYMWNTVGTLVDSRNDAVLKGGAFVQLDVSNLPNGLYIVEVVTADQRSKHKLQVIH